MVVVNFSIQCSTAGSGTLRAPQVRTDWSRAIRRFAQYLLLLLCAFNPASSQITSISIDLKNNLTFYETRQLVGTLRQRAYGQFYMLGVEGYALDPKLVSFNLQTTLTDYSSTNRYMDSEQSLRSRNLGYYNVSVTVLPNNGFPLFLYASRSEERSDAANSGYVAPVGTENSRDVERAGFRLNIKKNTYIPQMEIGFERSLSKGYSGGSPLRLVNDVMSLRMSNVTSNGASQYTFQYTGLRTNDDVFNINQTHHEFQFYSNTTLFERVSLYLNGLYAIRNALTTRNTEVGASYKQGDKLQHSLKLLNLENRFVTNRSTNTTTNSISYQASAQFSDKVQGTFGSNYSLQTANYGNAETFADRGQLNGQVTLTKRLATAEINGILGANIGFEKYAGGERKFIQQSKLGLGVNSQTFQRVQLSLRDDLTFATLHVAGNTIQNTVKLSAMTDLIPRCVVSAEVSRSDSRYFDYSAVVPRTIHAVGATLAFRASPTTVVETRHTQSWTRSWYLEKLYINSAALTESGLLSNLSLQVRGERVYNSFTNLEVVTIEGSLDYRLFALTIGGRYSYRIIGDIRTQGILVEFQRPFMFSFR